MNRLAQAHMQVIWSQALHPQKRMGQKQRTNFSSHHAYVTNVIFFNIDLFISTLNHLYTSEAEIEVN